MASVVSVTACKVVTTAVEDEDAALCYARGRGTDTNLD